MEFQKNRSLYQVILDNSKAFPNRIAMRYFGKEFSYSKLNNKINCFAGSLKKIGIQKNDVVCLCLPNIPQALYLLYALNQIGAIAFPIHPLLSETQIVDSMKQTKAKALFVLDSKFGCLKKVNKPVFYVSPADELPLFKKFFYHLKNKNNSNIKKFYTSQPFEEFEKDIYKTSLYLGSGGTTGRQKIICLSDFSINALCSNAPYILGINDGDKLSMLSILPAFHGFGLAVGIHMPLCFGACDSLMPKADFDLICKMIKKNQITFMIGVPVLFERLLKNEKFSGKRLKNLKACFVGGDSISKSFLDKFNKKMIENYSDCRIFEGYGLTETGSVCSVNTFEYHKDFTIGKSLPNIEFKVINPETKKEASHNEFGELIVAGETMANGYLDDNETMFINFEGKKWVKTGDCVSIDAEGYVTFKQRYKRIIKVNGIPIFPSEIEDYVSTFDFVFENCFTGVEDKRHGHIGKLFIVLNNKVEVDKENVINILNKGIIENFGIYAKPKEIDFMDELPHTNVGKIDFKELK